MLHLLLDSAVLSESSDGTYFSTEVYTYTKIDSYLCTYQ